MKTRSGFVSNSSSSSFIIAVKEPDTCPFCKRSDNTFLDRIRESTFSDTLIEAQGINEVLERCEPGEERQRMVTNYQLVHLSEVLAIVSISNHDPLHDEMQTRKDITVLEGTDYA